MNRTIVSFLFLLSAIPAFTQQASVFQVDATRTTPLKLSDIAEKVIPIPLSRDVSSPQGAFWTGEYLFFAAMRSVWQYDASGKYLRTIPCGGNMVYGIAGDLVKKEVYVPVRISEGEKSELWCYDYSGKLKKKIALKNSSIVSCLFHDNVLWLLSEQLEGNKMCGHYSYVDISSGKETFLPERFEKPFIELSPGEYIPVGFVGALSMSNNRLFANWDNNVIWRIQKNKVEPVLKCKITQKYRENMIGFRKGIVGNYLFFNYCLDDGDSNLYLRHLKTGKTYNVKYIGSYGNYTTGAVDDIYHSGYFEIKAEPLNQNGYFYFIKNMRGKSLGNTPVKGNQVVFMVKTKQ